MDSGFDTDIVNCDDSGRKMNHFYYSRGELFCEQVRVQDLAETVGTPFYLYSASQFLENYRQLDSAFEAHAHRLFYALKANSNFQILKRLAAQGSGADVVSGGELFLALKAGFPPEKIVYAGVGKTDAELRLAIENGIAAINVESVQELEVIQLLAQEMGKAVNVALRVNPDIDVYGHPHISTGNAFNKFGIDWQVAPQVYEHARKNLPNVHLVGIHCHIGSMIFNMEYYKAAAIRIKSLVEKIQELGIHLKHIDLGGGLGVDYNEPVLNEASAKKVTRSHKARTRQMAEIVLPVLEPLNCEIFLEPGRSVIANAGILVTKVLFVKETRGKRFVCLDTGMHHLIRPSLYDAFHQIIPLQENQRERAEVDIVGPVCESTDFLAKNRLLPRVERGELLAIMTTGAYGFSMASNYNAQPLPPEILVEQDRWQVIRKRQEYHELLARMA